MGVELSFEQENRNRRQRVGKLANSLERKKMHTAQPTSDRCAAAQLQQDLQIAPNEVML